jgi:hypothetical protein
MAGFGPAIHKDPETTEQVLGMPGPSPGMNDARELIHWSAALACVQADVQGLNSMIIITTELCPGHPF